MEKNTQKGFFNGFKRKNMIKYQEIFFNKIKSLLLYFIKIFEDGIMIPKEYLDNCVVKRPD